jgi:hypothetical protein
VLVSGDVGHALRVQVTASNVAGSGSVLSDATAVVAPPGQVPASTATPVISGSAVAGSTLALSNGSWSGTQPLSFRYSWQRCDTNGNNCTTISGATSDPYTLTVSDVAHRVRGAVQAYNLAGESTAYSLPSGVVASLAPFDLAPPKVSGNAVTGSTLKASTGTWSGSTPISPAGA